MEQISLPYRIALVALVVVGGLWFTVLRPKPESASKSSTAPGVTGLANDVTKAKDAANASNAANAAAGADATSTTQTPTSAAPQAGTPAKNGEPADKGLAADAVAGDPS